MTNPSDEEPESPLVIETQALAEKIVKSISDYLASLGWDFALVSISRRIDIASNHCAAPGATGLHIDRARMAPALDSEADALRTMAKHLDEMVDKRGTTPAGSYVHDKTDYASGATEWPK